LVGSRRFELLVTPTSLYLTTTVLQTAERKGTHLSTSGWSRTNL
jgi:hypothetical protein